MEKISSYNELLKNITNQEKAFLLLFKSGGEQSICAYKSLEEAVGNNNSLLVYYADVNEVTDIHEKFGINSVPSLLIFENGAYVNNIKGCHNSGYYKALLANAVYQAKMKADGKVPKQVTVYSTPTCSWCNALKGWLRKNGIPFTDIDVSRDEKAAHEMVSRTGQQGVPQTDINGKMVVGFDQQKLKELLEIQ
jgi:glutaredoxin-like YruB-family protein